MKKNSKTYILLAFVAAIWGLIGFKIIGALATKTPKEEFIVASNKYIPKNIEKRDTFSISANYRDPFLGTMPKKNIPKTIKKVVVKKPELPKINIVYSGLIAENNTKNKMFFVSINGQQHLISKNETVKEVKLISGNSETIKVKYNGSIETIDISK